MMEIKLRSRHVALIDDEDYDRISIYKWYYHTNGHAIANISKKSIAMHRLILDAPNDLEVDHINHNRLDNRKKNLRLVSHSQNMSNILKCGNVSSKYKGVLLNRCSPTQNYQAKIMKNGKQIHLGTFNTQEKAALAYNKAAIKLFGEYACLNKVEEVDLK